MTSLPLSAASASPPRALRIEAGLLAALLFVLPALEAPKNVLAVAWLGLWAWNRARAGDWGGAWRWADTVLAAWAGTAVLGAVFAMDRALALGNLADPLRSVVLCWAVSRAGFDARAQAGLLLAAVAGIVLPLVHGTWLAYGTTTEHWITLNSVGHVNHSALYLVLGLVCALSLRLTGERHPQGRRLLLVLTLWFGVSLLLTASRAAILAGLVVGTALVWRMARRGGLSRRQVFSGMALALGLLALTAGLSVKGGPDGGVKQTWIAKFHTTNTTSGLLSFRDQTWGNAIDAVRRHPSFGVGLENYSRLTPALLCTWRRDAGLPCDEATRLRFDHAHGLIFQTLADRGLVGAAALLALLVLWAHAALRGGAESDPHREAVRLACAGALGVVLVAGIMNTTLRVEHGLFALLLLGLRLDALRRPA